ncbi:type II toxin-antitoxin system RelE/ParE family toxin [Ursidibacter arcticus]
MYIIEQTPIFKEWLKSVKDPIAKITMVKRIVRAENGNFGDHKLLPKTDGIYEMRIDTGKGYRIYYAQAGEIIYLLTNGGDKTTQQADIEKAQIIWADYQQQATQNGENNE